jgi:hypothetical protein
MKPSSNTTFDRFVSERIKDLELEVRFVRGRQKIDEVISECWLIARELCSDETLAELQNPEIQDLVIKRLFRGQFATQMLHAHNVAQMQRTETI